MYVVTNRRPREGAKGLAAFGDRPNEKGPNELRLAKVTRTRSDWRVEFLNDKLARDEVVRLKGEFKLNLDEKVTHYASLKVACELARRARRNKTHIVLFVHGFNNDVTDVVQRAEGLAKRYGVEAVPFSWPANGGGLRGVASYKSDKRDARVSVGAFDRTLTKLHDYLQLITAASRETLWQKARRECADNMEMRDACYAKLIERDCPFTVNLMLHSMGNYLLKQMLKSTASEGTSLTFDNVVMAAADTNNLDHAPWVERIKARCRVFITINEHDQALAASRAKAGQDQLARLGHYPRNLDAANAYYVDFTDATWVGAAHAYFEGGATRNKAVKSFFDDALNGRRAESRLDYDPATNCYHFAR